MIIWCYNKSLSIFILKQIRAETRFKKSYFWKLVELKNASQKQHKDLINPNFLNLSLLLSEKIKYVLLKDLQHKKISEPILRLLILWKDWSFYRSQHHLGMLCLIINNLRRGKMTKKKKLMNYFNLLWIMKIRGKVEVLSTRFLKRIRLKVKIAIWTT